jgi:hypothetical protein
VCRDDAVVTPAPETAIPLRGRYELRYIGVGNYPSDADGTVINPDAWRIAHASQPRDVCALKRRVDARVGRPV